MLRFSRHHQFAIGVLSTFIACLACLAAEAAAVGTVRKPIVTSDLLRLRTVSEIDISGDDAFAVLAVRSIAAERGSGGGASNEELRYSYRSHLYLLDLTEPNVQPRQLTHGARNDRDPRISPDGRFVAFVRRGDVAENDDERRSQVWVLPIAGGEARQVTMLEHGAARPRWSPDGLRLLVSSTLPMRELDGAPPWPRERPMRDWDDFDISEDDTPRPDGTREQIRAWLNANAQKHDPNLITRLNFQEEQRLRREKRFRQLFLVDLAPNGEPAEVRQLTNSFFDHDDAEFMPNGREIAYVANKRTDVHPDRIQTSSLWMLRIDGTGAGDTGARELLAMDDWRFRAPQPSRDGSVIAFIGRHQDEPSFRQWQLGIASLNNGLLDEPMWLTDEQTFDYSVRQYQWHPSRAALHFTAAVEGGFPLMTASPGLLKPAAIIEHTNGMPVGVHAFAAGRETIVYAQTTPANPCTVRIARGRDDRLAFDLNEWVNERELSMPVEGVLEREDGTRVQYWIMEPTHRAQGETYPLVLQIHGGPSAMWGPGELSMWHEFQLMCSWGYGVVYANPRGSGGYGYQFQRANFQDWGHGPAGDVLAAVDRATELDWVDPERLVVTGGSYAGYLTAWIIAHDHRFKAAVAQRGVYHLPTFFGEGNAWRLVERAMGGHPYESHARETMERESPFNYVRNIQTPLLIMHASEDLRTGVSQSEMLYRALKALEMPVEYVRYPGAGHDLSRTGEPRQRMDRLNRIIEFFERHIDNPREAPTLDKASAVQEAQ